MKSINVSRKFVTLAGTMALVCATGLGGRASAQDMPPAPDTEAPDTEAPDTETPETPPAQPGDVPSLTQEEIFKVLDVVNTAEIRGSRFGVRRAQDAQIKAFAGVVARDHRYLGLLAADVAMRAEVTPAESETSTMLETMADEMFMGLRTVEEAMFDTAFLDGQISGHEQVLKLIDASQPCAAQAPAEPAPETGAAPAQSACIRFGLPQNDPAAVGVEAGASQATEVQGLLAIARARIVAHLIEAKFLRNRIGMTPAS